MSLFFAITLPVAGLANVTVALLDNRPIHLVLGMACLVGWAIAMCARRMR